MSKAVRAWIDESTDTSALEFEDGTFALFSYYVYADGDLKRIFNEADSSFWCLNCKELFVFSCPNGVEVTDEMKEV